MSTLQVANVHLESTANNRIQYTGSNTVTVYAAGVGTVVVNSTAVTVGSSIVNTTAVVVGTSVINSTSVNAAALARGGAAVMTVSNTNQTITGGTNITSLDLGTVSAGTLTLDMGARPLQHYNANGAHTLAPGSNTGSVLLDITNGTGTPTFTTSGWTHVAGEAFTTTSTHKFRCHCSVGQNGSLLLVEAMQ